MTGDTAGPAVVRRQGNVTWVNFVQHTSPSPQQLSHQRLEEANAELLSIRYAEQNLRLHFARRASWENGRPGRKRCIVDCQKLGVDAARVQAWAAPILAAIGIQGVRVKPTDAPEVFIVTIPRREYSKKFRALEQLGRNQSGLIAR